ncbi:MAG: type III-B CRISPR module-associated protein Cmr5 [Planctomycetaceae bacterium]|nr:type III-B CRISPR module-associated protein Cmr5 [Planctomycetaceae bacterium]
MSQTETTTPKQTLDQQRACHALARIEKLSLDDQDNYASEAKRLPVRIMSSGLGQAMAFINAKTKRTGLKQLHTDLTEWVIKIRATNVFGEDRVNEFNTRPGARQVDHSLLHSIIHGDSEFLRWATTETLAYLVWLNRFAEAKGLPGKHEGD